MLSNFWLARRTLTELSMACLIEMAWNRISAGQPMMQLANVKIWGKLLRYCCYSLTQHKWVPLPLTPLSINLRYYPSVFVLKPGQVVHINKGRLHAFRKLAPQALQETDCHYDLRNEVLQTKENGQQEDLCFSIAWDWMFKGVTSDGINREVSSILECSRLNREHELASLAIPET